jgi:hypothetical protein
VRSGALIRPALLALSLAGGAVPAAGQVFQVQGGGSSLFEGYGGTVNIWGDGYEASLGIGYLDGIRIGASARRLIFGGRDTLRIGNDLLPFTLDTDVFGTGGMLFAQGASLQRRRGGTRLWIFGGASASTLSAPYFSAQRPSRAMSYAKVQHDVTPGLSLGLHAISSERQTLLASAAWEAAPGLTTAATGGIGSNTPYMALSLNAKQARWEAKAALVAMANRFRRSSAPMPLQSEIEGDNLLLAWKPSDRWSIGAGRQHFRQDSSFQGLPRKATLHQLTMTGRGAGTTFSAGWLVSEAGRAPNVSSYLTGRRQLLGWLQSEMYLLRVWEPQPARVTTPVLLLRETLSPRLSLLQTITREQRRTSVNFGGTLSSGLSSVSIDYQVAHSPYLAADPFVQTMGLNARLQVKGVALALGSFVTPDGTLHYTAQGGTFLYRGNSGVNGGGGDAIAGRIDQFIVAGRVIDESGQPVEGASLEIDRELVYTDSRGNFFLRRRSAKTVPVRLLPNDFLIAGSWEVVDAPPQATPRKDSDAARLTIVVRRVGPTDRQGTTTGSRSKAVSGDATRN